jgi:hypothetical protein
MIIVDFTQSSELDVGMFQKVSHDASATPTWSNRTQTNPIVRSKYPVSRTSCRYRKAGTGSAEKIPPILLRLFFSYCFHLASSTSRFAPISNIQCPMSKEDLVVKYLIATVYDENPVGQF